MKWLWDLLKPAPLFSSWKPPTRLANPIILGRFWRHEKTGKHYEVLGTGYIEATLTPCVIYRRKSGDDIVWVRPLEEFLDGRFEDINLPRDVEKIKGL